MKKILIFLMFVAYSFIDCAEKKKPSPTIQKANILRPFVLNTINPINVEKHKSEIAYEFQKNKYIKIAMMGTISAAVMGYWIYNKMQKPKELSYSYEDKVVLHELIKLYKSGNLVSKPGWLKSALGTVSSFSSGVINSILVAQAFSMLDIKNLYINWIEKSRINSSIKSLKFSLANLSPESKIFNLVVFPLIMPNQMVNNNIATKFIEIYDLKAASITSRNSNAKEIADIVNQSVVLTNNLTASCEVLIAFFDYKSETLKQDNFLVESEMFKQSKIELENCINNLKNNIQTNLDLIISDKANIQKCDLLSSIFSFEQSINQILDRIEILL